MIPPGILNTPKQLVIDQWAGWLYVCDREGMRIVRCKLDGSQMEDIVRAGDSMNAKHQKDIMPWFVGLTIDWDCRNMYWTPKGLARGTKAAFSG